jgi:hypothetical protein
MRHEVKKQKPVAHDILVFGRGSDPDRRGGRLLSKIAMLRVDAVLDYIQANNHVEQASFRVLFSAGWAANTGMRKPEPKFREAYLMQQYADSIGLRRLKNVVTGTQIESMSTVQDALLAAKSGFFGSRPFEYNRESLLGIVAQAGSDTPSDPNTGHMARCLEAASRTFRIPTDALLPIYAEGKDIPDSGLTEKQAAMITRVLFCGARFDFDIMLRNRLFMASVVLIQKSRQWLDQL